MRLTSIGDLGRMPGTARERLEKCMADTSACTGLTLVLALSYSSRWEILRAVRSLAADTASGALRAEDIDEATFASRLSTAGMPDPDLLIRISNYLLYQIAYSELIFTPTYWPDYSKEDFRRHIAEYQRRQRRFGLTGEQASENPPADKN